MRKALSLAAVAVLALLLVTVPTVADETAGDIIVTSRDADGGILPGVTVTIKNDRTGLQRSFVANDRGEVRFAQLPVGVYTVTSVLDGFQTYQRDVTVRLGGTAVIDAEMQVGAIEDTLVVTGDAPLIDTTSTVSGLTVNTGELTERVPVVREATAVALLAPATTSGDGAFDGRSPGQSLASIGGSSVAENTYLVNGLNITNFRNGLGSNQVPFEMVQEIQVKTGGYEAEFGWSTGGVINVVTKSGSNEWHGGANAYHEPESLQEQSPDTVNNNINSLEDREITSVNAFIGGPIWKDRAFFFALYEERERNTETISGGQDTQFTNTDPFYGGKLDFNLSSNHRVEGTYFKDETTVDGASFGFDNATRTTGNSVIGNSFDDRGGENYTGRYTGIFGSSFVLAAQYGHNEFARTSLSSTDLNPAIIDSRNGAFDFLGNWVNFQVSMADDTRDMYRVDGDVFLNQHSLRAGITEEENVAFDETVYTGGIYYRYYNAGAGQFPGVAAGTEVVRERVFEGGGNFETVNTAVYVQDQWEIGDRFQLNAGLRVEEFDNKNAAGESFINVSDQYGPRIGFIADLAGDGRSKLYTNYGRYFLPIAANTNIRLSGAEFFTEDWFLLNGLNGDGTPNKGALVESNVFSDGTIPDVRETRSQEIDPFYQDELVIGYEKLVGNDWTVGIRGVAREIGEIIEDVTINQAVAAQLGLSLSEFQDQFGGANHYVLLNPGQNITTFWDYDGDGSLNELNLTAEELGYPAADRQYYAAEFTFNRRFSDNYMLQGSYTWSHSYGNYEGWVRSDNGQDDAGITTLYDFPGLLDGASGNLPNDRRHNLKIFGAYRFDMGLMVGANATYRTGRPLNAFGIHPTDEGAASYGAESFFQNGTLVPRGSVGTTDDITNLDLTFRYDIDLGSRVDLSLRADAFNIFNEDTATELVETAEEESGAVDADYLLPTRYQRPRGVRLGLALTF